MKLLIIEDDQHKEEDLSAFVRSQYPGLELRARHSYQSGLKEAVNWTPSLILLDMSMPVVDARGRSADVPSWPYAGRELLREITRKRIASKIIVVTQYEAFGGKDDRVTLEELKIQLKAEFPANYITSVYYHVSQSAWRGELIAAIDSLRQDVQQ